MSELQPTLYQNYIALSRYARYRRDLGRRETWGESVDRLIDFWRDRLGGYVDEETFAKVREFIVTNKVMPSMRSLMTAGEALTRDETAGYNCAYTACEGVGPEVALWDSKLQDMGFDEPIHVALRTPIVFDCILYVLLCGTGMGFSVERQFVNTLPTVGRNLSRSIYKPTDVNFPRVPVEDLSTIENNVIQVADSKYGWASALRILLVELYNGNFDVKYDLSRIRPAGAVLKTFGGRASGPGPLKSLFDFAIELFKEADGRKLTSVECHDLVCKIAESVVSGGVRRSALISLSNLSDDRMRHAKSGEWWNTDPQRALANNSVCYTEKPNIGTFLREWESLYMSRSGERGIFNREAARKLCEKIGRDPNHEWGTNPCCVTGDTYILTDEGHLQIRDTVGKSVVVWNGYEWSETVPFSVGVHPTLVVSLSDGTELVCTSNHKFLVASGARNKDYKRVLASDLTIGTKLAKFSMPVLEDGEEYEVDPYSQGFYSGDGNTGREFSWVYEPKYPCIHGLIGRKSAPSEEYGRVRWDHGPMLPKSFVPVNGSMSYCLRWLAGLLDSDGTVTRDKNGNGFQIASIDKQFLLDVKLMLARLGVQAKVVRAKDAGRYLMPNGKGGEDVYDCQAVSRLLIGYSDTYHLGKLGLETLRLEWHKNPPQRDARRFVSVVEISQGPTEEVFCFDEPLNHTGTFNGIVTGQSEILLRPAEFCNLSEIVVRHNDTSDSLLEKAEVAAILGTWQATLTNFTYLPPIWKQNCEEERLLGVSLTGIMDHPVLSSVSDEAKLLLNLLRDRVNDTNKVWAKRLNINPAAATTCVKPSGTVSQLVDAASGLHPRYSQFYIRRVRADKKDPLATTMQQAGFPCEQDVMQPNNLVFSFPIKAPEGAVMRDDRSALDQLEHWLMIQDEWCEHKPSITVYVREHEWLEVGAWVYKHFDKVSGVSFLPHSDHSYQQAPYEEIDEATYLKLASELPTELPMDLLAQMEKEDMTTGTREFACTGGACEI